MFAKRFSSQLALIEDHLKKTLHQNLKIPHPQLESFWEAMGYSLFSPGKRFRPLLSLLTAEALQKDLHEALPVASAVELIHTYSLIHDDLPCMDDDDLRRGRPTSHKVYGEAKALLAGDALLTLAFQALAESPSKNAARAVSLLAQAVGAQGMVGGQVLDIESQEPSLEILEKIHELKTGALIKVAVEATAVLLMASEKEQRQLASFGKKLGLAFQLADDVEDHNPEKPEKVNFVNIMNLDGTLAYLCKVSQEAYDSLEGFPKAEGLREMIRLNQLRLNK